jgi:predicted RNase H-like HicB family nuclease
VPKRLFGKKELEKPYLAIPILCRFWEEDGVWNAAAHDLPVAVFGKTLQQAKKHLNDALMAHFEALHELGKAQATIEP